MRSLPSPLRVAFALLAVAAAARAQTMHIESCNLGCSSGGGGPVSCAVTTHAADAELRIRFSRPIDPVSVSFTTFQIVNVNNGTIAVGARLVDPLDPQVLVFRPQITWDGAGNPVFGFEPNAIYRITVPGVAQGDAPPFLVSADVPALANQNRMSCDVLVLPATPAGAVICDGTQGCPCGNSGLPSRGCANSIDPGGVGLESGGTPSVTSDTVKLWLHGIGQEAVFYVQGSQRENGGAGTPFGDGLRCIGGDVVRLRSHGAGGSHWLIPTGSRSISEQGRVPAAGATRVYQALYRNTGAFCDPLPLNWTNAVEIVWSP